MNKIRNILIAGAVALALPLAAVASPASASTSHSKFINSLHAWLPTTKGSNSTEIREGDRICSDLDVNAISEGPFDGKRPYGFNAIFEEEGNLDEAEVKNGYFVKSNPNAYFVLSADLIGVSVLNLCPGFEPAVRYVNRTGGEPVDFPTTNKVPRSILAAGWSGKNYGYSAPPPSTTTTTTTTTTTLPAQSPAQVNASIGSPPGNGTPWASAPKALVNAVEKSAADDANGAFRFPTGTTYWMSQDPNANQWYYVAVDAPASEGIDVDLGGAGIAENQNGSWVIVAAVGDQAPGCYGPEYQDLPAGTSDVPSNVMSDFSLSC